MTQSQKTPLIELLRDAPVGHKTSWPFQWSYDGHPTGHSHSPVGRLMHEAADEIQRLQARVSELEPSPEQCERILQTIANDVCGNIPEEWLISLHMGCGIAWVENSDPDYEAATLPDSAEKSLLEQIGDALKIILRSYQ